MTTISALSPGAQAYWAHYSSGGAAASTVTFKVTAKSATSALKSQAQVFNVTGSPSTNIETPFGVPFWGGNLTSGAYTLRVSNNLGQSASCAFTVTP